MEPRKKRLEQYMWTTSSRLKLEPITDVKIHPNSKPALLTIYRGNDRRNFDVHNPFEFADFGVTEYERLRKIPEEIRIQSALPALAPKQAPSQSLGRKRKHQKLEPEIKIPGLECNRSLPKNVPFVNNMVIEEPEYRTISEHNHKENVKNVQARTRVRTEDGNIKDGKPKPEKCQINSQISQFE
ncbi:hypothetical protein Tco_0051361 [Tanacetum coccineum]